MVLYRFFSTEYWLCFMFLFSGFSAALFPAVDARNSTGWSTFWVPVLSILFSLLWNWVSEKKVEKACSILFGILSSFSLFIALIDMGLKTFLGRG